MSDINKSVLVGDSNCVHELTNVSTLWHVFQSACDCESVIVETPPWRITLLA